MSSRIARTAAQMALMFVTSAALVAQAPDPSNPNVLEHKIRGSSVGTLKVKKSTTVAVTEIWKKVDGAWVMTWSHEEGGPYAVDKQASKTSEVTKSDGTDFTPGDEYRFVIEPTDSSGNSTSIESVTEQ